MAKDKTLQALIMIILMTVAVTFAGCSSNNHRNNSNPIVGTPRPISGTPYDGGDEKTKLTLATGFDNNYHIRNLITAFNAESDKYYVEIIDYSMYSTDDNYLAGQTKLITEMTAGVIPDILEVTGLPFSRYAAKGLFEDLYPFIDADPELQRDDLIENVLRLMETDGALYRASSYFGISTLMGKSSVLGDNIGWTMDEFLAVINNSPGADYPIDPFLDKTLLFAELLSGNMDAYVDQKEGKCFFDSDEFVMLLNFVNTLPEATSLTGMTTQELIAQDRQIVSLDGLSNFLQIRLYRMLFGGDIVFKGYPVGKGAGNILWIGPSLAMTGACSDKQGAWEFIRTILTADSQRSYASFFPFPTNKTVFYEMAEDAKTPEYEETPDGERVEVAKETFLWYDDTPVEIYALTEDEVNQVFELIDSASYLLEHDQVIMDIIYEVTAGFFNGFYNAEAAAEIIQSRAQIYLSEQG